jgi:hypothetical protein
MKSSGSRGRRCRDDGRYTDFDAVVDVLTQYAVGVLPLAHDAATAKSQAHDTASGIAGWEPGA